VIRCEHGVYMRDFSRINVAEEKARKLDYIAQSVLGVL
jgi:aspartate/tyrosine/aromatic aminotransferase